MTPSPDEPADQRIDAGADHAIEDVNANAARRRAIMRKLAVGAFAAPVILAALTATPAHAS